MMKFLHLHQQSTTIQLGELTPESLNAFGNVIFQEAYCTSVTQLFDIKVISFPLRPLPFLDAGARVLLPDK